MKDRRAFEAADEAGAEGRKWPHEREAASLSVGGAVGRGRGRLSCRSSSLRHPPIRILVTSLGWHVGFFVFFFFFFRQCGSNRGTKLYVKKKKRKRKQPRRKCSWVTGCPKIKSEKKKGGGGRGAGGAAAENKTHVRRRGAGGGVINDADTLKAGRHLATILSPPAGAWTQRNALVFRN